MTGLIVLPNPSELMTPDVNPVDGWVAAWLDAKASKSGSAKTLIAYRDNMADFRAVLHRVGLDLNSHPHQISLAAQGWAGKRRIAGDDRLVSASTYNQRTAILASFYEYAIKHEFLSNNPIRRVERRTVQAYANVKAIDSTVISRKLATIDRSDRMGQRDFALLSVARKTGRRLSELAALRWRDLLVIDGQVTLTFQHTKGGKVMADKLTVKLSQILLGYLYAVYGRDLGAMAADAPVWVSVSNRTRGQALSIQTIADICTRRLGVSKVHALRHTFAKEMIAAGAPLNVLQARLGHASLATTGIYAAELGKADNPFADKLDELDDL